MDLLDVYEGRLRWSDYILNQTQVEALDHSLQGRVSLDASDEPQGSLALPLAPGEYAIAVGSGLGAVGTALKAPEGVETRSIKLGLDKLAGGIDRLNADFNLLLGDAIWKLEMRQETLSDILQEIRLAEFEREARAYRSRAERAYLNRWYQEALSDFLEAEKRNYPDFSIHRSIASIYLYHVIDPERAIEYFRKAAKYAEPSDARLAAEAHYFAGIACAVERRREESLRHLRDAVRLNPALSEAHYQLACVAALTGEIAPVVSSLEAAIEIDPRYHERAKNDRIFDSIRPEVNSLLESLMRPVQERLAEVRQGLKPIPGYVIARSEEERLAEELNDIERQMAEAKTYKGGLEFLKALSRFQEQLRNLFDLFRKQYQIDLNDYVRSVSFSPDGRLLAAGFLNGGIKLFQVYTGQKTSNLDGHAASVNSVAFSPNSRLLASGSRDKTIKLWNVDSGGEIQTLRGHDGEVRSVAFSPDGNWLVSGSHDHTVRIWRAVTGREVQVLGEHKHHVTAVVFSPNGRWLASSSLDKTIKLWDVTTGRAVRTLRGHTKGVESLAFSPDGRLIASGGADRQIKIWNIDGRELQTLGGLPNDVTSVAFSPDGNLLAAGSLGRTIKVWRVAAGELIKTVRFTEISYNSVAFSPEGQWLAMGSRDLQFWLKVVLTEEGYAAVKAGEERAAIESSSPHGSGASVGWTQLGQNWPA
jgi:tetratricopeptide (TPR) repeat protein